jgi:hypothetical protein
MRSRRSSDRSSGRAASRQPLDDCERFSAGSICRRRDLTALSDRQGRQHLQIEPHFWLPGDGSRNRGSIARYDLWHRQGFYKRRRARRSIMISLSSGWSSLPSYNSKDRVRRWNFKH